MNIYRKLLTLFLAITFLTAGLVFYQKNTDSGLIVRAFGPLQVTFPSVPMFNESNWFPGKTVTKTITIKNTDFVTRKIGIKADNFQDSGVVGLSQGLSLVLASNGSLIYGEGSPTGFKKLDDFYAEPVVWLGTLTSGSQADFDFTVSMQQAAGNEFQGSVTAFDLIAGIDTELVPVPSINPIPTLALIPTIPIIPVIPTLQPIPTIRPIPFILRFRLPRIL